MGKEVINFFKNGKRKFCDEIVHPIQILLTSSGFATRKANGNKDGH